MKGSHFSAYHVLGTLNITLVHWQPSGYGHGIYSIDNYVLQDKSNLYLVNSYSSPQLEEEGVFFSGHRTPRPHDNIDMSCYDSVGYYERDTKHRAK